MSQVAALILAAGMSRRMGQMKQLLDLGGLPILERVMRKVMVFPFCEIVTVIGYGAEQIHRHISLPDDRFRWVENRDYEKGQSTSLHCGMASIRTDHVMVFLADQPFINDGTIRFIYDEGLRRGTVSHEPLVVRPIFRLTPGHPVFFGNVHKINFVGLTGDRGAKPLIDRIANRYLIAVDDDKIVYDIDTPEAYVRAKRIWESQYE